jgi:hypothetical protein
MYKIMVKSHDLTDEMQSEVVINQSKEEQEMKSADRSLFNRGKSVWSIVKLDHLG